MIGLIIAFAVALVLSISLTPVLIHYLIRHQYGQFIRQDGPTAHMTKRDTHNGWPGYYPGDGHCLAGWKPD